MLERIRLSFTLTSLKAIFLPQIFVDICSFFTLAGQMPTEMFLHFFKSLSDASKMNLNIKAEGQNEHHKIEGIFKALARALKMAVRRDIYHYELPSTKGML